MVEFNLKISDALAVNSSMGNLLKWQTTLNNRKVYVKTSTYSEINFTGMWLFESYSEVIVCRLFKELGIDNVLAYNLCKINIDNGQSTIGCYSYSFLKEEEKYISLADLHKCGVVSNYMFEGYNGYMQCISDMKRLFNIDYKSELDKILTLDYLIMNQDRHTGNLGFIYNYKTKDLRMAPIFDNGMSLFSLKFIEDMQYSTHLDQYIRSKPFYYSHEQQLAMIKKPYNINYNISKIYEYTNSLKKYGLDSRRINFINQLISTRLDILSRYTFN